MAKVFCRRCKQQTNHRVVNSHARDYTPENTPGMQIDWARGKWEILECQGCEEITFAETWLSSEDQNNGTGDFEPTTAYYPPRGERQRDIKSIGLPPELRGIYRETIDAYNNDSRILCAAGLRAIIEALCVWFQVKNGLVEETNKDGTTRTVRRKSLEGKIEGLREGGVLTRPHARTLHENRFMGNDAVHELAVPRPDDLELALDIVEQTLEHVFDLPAKGRQLERMRTMRKKRKDH